MGKARLAAVVLGALVLSAVAGFAQKVEPKSEQPLYAAIACKQDGERVLRLVFDESKGTGQGHDVLYADTNFDGQFSAPEKLTGKVQSREGFIYADFPTFSTRMTPVGVPEGAEVVTQYTITHYAFQREQGWQRSFRLQTRVKWPAEAGGWQYDFVGPLQVFEKPQGIVAAECGGEIRMELDIRPDPGRPGNIGIAANLVAEGSYLRVSRGEQPLVVKVTITNEQGSVIREDMPRLDQMAYG